MMSILSIHNRKPYQSGAARSVGVDPFAPIVTFIFFYLFEFAFPYVYVLMGGEFVSERGRTGGLTNHYIDKAMLTSVVFALGWLAAYMLVWRRTTKEKRVDAVPRLSVGVVSVIYCVIVVGYFTVVYSSPALGEGKAEMVQGGFGMLLVLAMCLLLSMLAVLVIVIGEDRSYGQKQVGLTTIIALLVVFVGIAFLGLLLLQMRSRALSALVLALMVWHYTKNRIMLKEYLVFLLCATLGAIAISYFEIASNAGSDTPFLADVAFGLDYRRNFDGLYNAALLMLHLDSRREPYDYGWGIVADFLADFRLAPSDYSSSRLFFMEEVIGLSTYKAGIALSKVGEVYRAGGMLGALVGGALLGALSKCLYRSLIGRRPLGTLSIPIYYFALLSGCATPRGYIGGKWLFSLMLCLIFVCLAFVFFKVQVERRRPKIRVCNA